MNTIENLILDLNNKLNENPLVTDEVISEISNISDIIMSHNRKILDCNNIIDIVFNYLNIEKEHNFKSRKRELVEARQISWYFMKKYTNRTLSKIGDAFEKDHSLVLHGMRNINNRYDTERRLRETMNKIEALIIEDKEALKAVNLYKSIYK